jgi:hypothetical protein
MESIMSTAINLERANLDPASVFGAPRDVVTAKDLSPEDKRSILIKWEADADALLRATDEGMEPTPGHRSPAEILRAVQAAMQQLDGEPPSAEIASDIGC